MVRFLHCFVFYNLMYSCFYTSMITIDILCAIADASSVGQLVVGDRYMTVSNVHLTVVAYSPVIIKNTSSYHTVS